jgi:hypothetical protein
MLDESRAQADRSGCLSNATLLVAYDENRQFGSFVTRETVAEIGVKLGAAGECFVPSILAQPSLADYLSVPLREVPGTLHLQPF